MIHSKELKNYRSWEAIDLQCSIILKMIEINKLKILWNNYIKLINNLKQTKIV